jgi:hypothetical protein
LDTEGRVLRQKAYSADLSEACRLTYDEFVDTRNAVLKLRNNLARSLSK